MSSTKAKILILSGRNPKNMRGGASTWMLNIDPFFQKDYEVDYLVLSEWWLNLTFIPDRIKASVYALYTLLIYGKKWDIFLSHSPELSFIATLFSKNVVHIAHGNTNPMTNPTFRLGKLFFKLFEYFNSQVENKAKLLYTVGEEKAGYTKINQPINHDIQPMDVDKKSGLIFVGRLEKIKNIDFIIKAYSQLPESVKKHHHLYIYGRGTEENNLLKLIKSLKQNEYITLKGHIANKDVIQKINQASLLVMASSFEGFPMVVAEALTVGTPALSTAVGSIPCVIKNGNNGFCLPLDVSHEVYTSYITKILSGLTLFSKNALQSSDIFNASNVYEVIKKDMDKAFRNL